MSGLHQEIEQDFREILEDEDRGIVMVWNSQRFRGLLSTGEVELAAALGGFDAKAPAVIRVLRSAFPGGALPAKRDRITTNGRDYLVTGMDDREGWPVVVFGVDAIR